MSNKNVPIKAAELVGILSDGIRGIEDGSADLDEVNAISAATRSICSVVKTQMAVLAFNKSQQKQGDKIKLLSQTS